MYAVRNVQTSAFFAASSAALAAVIMKIPVVREQQALTLCFLAIFLHTSTMVINLLWEPSSLLQQSRRIDKHYIIASFSTHLMYGIIAWNLFLTSVS